MAVSQQASRDRLIFLAFEASSLIGWPIEIGLASVTGGSISFWATSIDYRKVDFSL